MCNLMANISVKENGNNGGLWDLFIFPWTVYHLCKTLFTCTIYVFICTCLQLPTNVFMDQSCKNISHCKSICATLIITIAATIAMFIVICKFMWSFYFVMQIQPTAKKRPDPKMYKKLIHKHTPPPPPPPEAPSSELECPPLPPSAPQGTPLSALPGKKWVTLHI